MDKKMQPIEVIQDTAAVLPLRINALNAFIHSDCQQSSDGYGVTLAGLQLGRFQPVSAYSLSIAERQSALIQQTRIELQLENDQFVLPLFEALGQFFHRDSIPFLLSLVQNEAVELIFRVEAVSLLAQFYLHAVTDLGTPFQISTDGYLDPILLARSVMDALNTEFFVLKGDPPTSADLQAIVGAFKAISADPSAPDFLREEAEAGLTDISAVDNALQG